MIFVGRNFEISFPVYSGHGHSNWADRLRYNLFNRWWNKLKDKDSVWGIFEWIVKYRKPVDCQECIDCFIEDENFTYFHGIREPTRKQRIEIVERLSQRKYFG